MEETKEVYKVKLLEKLSKIFFILSIAAIGVAFVPLVVVMLIAYVVYFVAYILIGISFISLLTLYMLCMPIAQDLLQFYGTFVGGFEIIIRYITPFAGIGALVFGLTAIICSGLYRSASKAAVPPPDPLLGEIHASGAIAAHLTTASFSACQAAVNTKKINQSTIFLVLGAICAFIGAVGMLFFIPSLQDWFLWLLFNGAKELLNSSVFFLLN